jgi:hypothetical protein
VTGAELILAALAAGADQGATGSSSYAVREAYVALRAALRQRLASNKAVERQAIEIIDSERINPESLRTKLATALDVAGASRDEYLLAAAQQVLQLVASSDTSPFGHTVRGAKGVQVGDHNTQSNVSFVSDQ